jgi:hypothetical protein
MHLPVDSKQESNFVLVNLFSSKSRDLAPGARRIISVLKILGGKDQSSKKHATAALECAVSMSVHRLFHCEIMFRHMRLDENQVIQSNLESRVTCPRAAQGFLDEVAQWQDWVV